MKKNHIIYFKVAAMTLLLSSCVNRELENEASAPADCMGVYFLEEQENIKAHTLDVDKDKAELEFVVRRVNADKEEYVNFEVDAYTIFKDDTYTDTSYREVVQHAEELFEFGDLYFEEGQKETTLKVWFEDIELGKTYTCSISINDPEYASVYENNASSITFSVQMYRWKKKGKAIWRDALFSDMFLWEGRYLETEVDIYERTDEEGKGYYRLDDVYSPSYLARLIEGEEEYEKNKEDLEKEYSRYVDPDTRILIDATDPEHVYFPLQKTGFSDPSMGDIMMASDVTEVWGAGSNLLYGTLKDNIITFPKNGLLISYGPYFYFSNSSTKFRLVLPGGKAEDYALELSAEEVDEEGNFAVTFTPAKDVKKVKYAMFEGRLNEAELDGKIEQILDDKVYTQTQSISGETTYSVTPSDEDAETGIYTLIACTLDETDTYKEHAAIELGYVSPDDKEGREVQIRFGVVVDDRYANAGEKEEDRYTKENSFQYWVSGKGITHAMFNYYTLSYYNAYKEKIHKELKDAGSIDNLALKTLNTSELAGIVGNRLKPCTKYVFVIYAGNGYRSEFKTLEFETLGATPDVVEDLMQKSYYYTDIMSGKSVSDYTGTSWVPVSMDIFDSEAEGRTIRGNKRAERVKFTVTEYPDSLTVSGLFPALKENPDIRVAFKDGVLYTAKNTLEDVVVRDSTNLIPEHQKFHHTYSPRVGCVSGTGYFYDTYETDDRKENYDMMRAGFVHEDIIAFTDNNTEHLFWTLILGGYQKFSDGEGLADFVGDAHGDLILVREGSELLKSLKESASNSPVEEGQMLNSINEVCRVEMPVIGSMVTDAKRVDMPHETVSFTSKEISGTSSSAGRKSVMTLRDEVTVGRIK